MNIKINALFIANNLTLIDDLKQFGKDYFVTLEVAHSAEDALNIHEVGRFDIIYIDLGLPDMNGLELIKNIKNYDKKQHFIILYNEDDEKGLGTLRLPVPLQPTV